jgi:hypothetical protein
MPYLVLACRWIMTTFGLLLLSSCVVEEGPRPPGGGPSVCTMEYDPVCARRNGEWRTFSNACAADAAGYEVLRRGACRRGSDGDGDGGSRVCTSAYDPVCGRRGGDRRTFGNDCEADLAGYRVVSRGECAPGGDRPGFCTREYRPVCARRGDRVQTFGNACTAEAEGFRVTRPGEC